MKRAGYWNDVLTGYIYNDSNIIQTTQIYIHIHKIKFQFVSNFWFQINTCKINTKKESNKKTIKYTIHLSSTNLLTSCISNDSNIIQTMQIYIHIHRIKFQFVSNSWFQFFTCKINTKKESNKETIKYTIHLSSTNLLTSCISNDSNIIQTMQIYTYT